MIRTTFIWACERSEQVVWLKDVLIKKKKKKKSQKGCIVKQHAVFSPTGQLSTFFLNCILSCRVHEMKNIVHLYNDPYYIYMGMRAKRASGLVEGCSY